MVYTSLKTLLALFHFIHKKRERIKIFQASVELSATPTVKCTYLLYGEKERVIVAGRGGDVNGNSCLRRLRPGSHQALFEETFDFKVQNR